MPLHIKFVSYIGLFLVYHVFPYVLSVGPAITDQCLVSSHKTEEQTRQQNGAVLTLELVTVKL